jgi:hypothetical protein
MQEYTQLMADLSSCSCFTRDDGFVTTGQLTNMVMWVTGQLKTLHRRTSGENWREMSFPFEVRAI